MDMTHRFPRPLVGENYAEASYFDGYAYQHVAAWHENLRLQRLREASGVMIGRRPVTRGIPR